MNTDSLPLPLEIRSVVKHFRAGSTLIHALNGVNLAVAAGEFVAIMGASGSGKSTLLHAMAGLTDVDSGQVRVDGQDLAELSDARLTRFRRRRIGLVFQAFNLIPSLTAEDNIRLPADAGADLDGRVEKLLERLELKARRGHKPDALSGGEQQRVAIARAVAKRPDVLLCDEPTGALDISTGVVVLEALAHVNAELGATVTVITHNAAIAGMAHRVVTLGDGRIVEDRVNESRLSPGEIRW